MHVSCIAAFSCYCFTTNVTYRLVQVKWFTTVIRFKSEVLPHCSCCVRLWNQFHLCFYSVKSQLALPLHSVMWGAEPHLPTQRQRVTDIRRTNKLQMEIIKAGKIIELIFVYRTINCFIDYRDRPTHNKYFEWSWVSRSWFLESTEKNKVLSSSITLEKGRHLYSWYLHNSTTYTKTI